MKGVLYGTLLGSATGAGTGSTCGPNMGAGGVTTFQAKHTVTGTGQCSSTIRIEVSNDPALFAPPIADPWVILGTISLFGSTAVTDGFSSNAPWRWIRANVLNASGVSTSINVWTASTLD